MCRKWRARRDGKEGGEDGERAGKRQREGRTTRGTRPLSGYETNSDLICRVYDSVFFSPFIFSPRGIKILAGIRLGGGLARAQIDKLCVCARRLKVGRSEWFTVDFTEAQQ